MVLYDEAEIAEQKRKLFKYVLTITIISMIIISYIIYVIARI